MPFFLLFIFITCNFCRDFVRLITEKKRFKMSHKNFKKNGTYDLSDSTVPVL